MVAAIGSLQRNSGRSEGGRVSQPQVGGCSVKAAQWLSLDWWLGAQWVPAGTGHRRVPVGTGPSRRPDSVEAVLDCHNNAHLVLHPIEDPDWSSGSESQKYAKT